MKLVPMFVTERLIDLIAPHLCISCGSEGSIICAWCLPDIAPPLPQRCYRCKAQTENSLVCKNCSRQSRLKHVWARTSYDGFAKQLARDFKFSRKQSAADPISELMVQRLPYLPVDTVVVHVPTASKRIRQRGYDHAQLLAKRLARRYGLTYSGALARSGKTRQVGASRQERLRQLDGAFRVVKNRLIVNKPVLLVDDIVTTGGSLEAAARCLKQAGARQVDAVVFAQR